MEPNTFQSQFRFLGDLSAMVTALFGRLYGISVHTGYLVNARTLSEWSHLVEVGRQDDGIGVARWHFPGA